MGHHDQARTNPETTSSKFRYAPISKQVPAIATFRAITEQIPGNKEAIWLNEYNQQQLYYEEEAVNAAINKVVEYLQPK